MSTLAQTYLLTLARTGQFLSRERRPIQWCRFCTHRIRAIMQVILDNDRFLHFDELYPMAYRSRVYGHVPTR